MINPSPVGLDSRSVVGRFLNQVLVEDDLEAVEQFVARVLRRAHESAEARTRRPRHARSWAWRICSLTS